MNSIKKLSIVTLALFSALAATAGGASAGGNHHFHGKHFHHKFHRHHGFHVVIGGGGGHGCGFYREMWEDTGSLKWKRRYFVCKGWW